MNIYVETNFVFELTFEQSEHESCKEILAVCEAGRANLIIPAYSLAEVHEKLTRQANIRRELQSRLNDELGQLKRTASYTARITSIQDVASLLVQSNEEERQRFAQYRDVIINVAEIIPLTVDVLRDAASYEAPYDLTSQDAIVFASVIKHLQQDKISSSCFLNRNSKDFDNPDIQEELRKNNCRLISSFHQGYSFIQSQVSS